VNIRICELAIGGCIWARYGDSVENRQPVQFELLVPPAPLFLVDSIGAVAI
jgi:hypothetical protein